MDYLAEITKDIDAELFDPDTGLTETGKEVIERVETAFKQLETARKALREKVLQNMMDIGIVMISTPSVKIRIKDAYDREGVDTARLKEEQPEIYDEYCKVTPVKESLVVKVG